MKCEEVRERINEYIDGELTEEEAALVTAHINTCVHCREIMEDMRRTTAALASLGKADVPDFVAPALKQIEEEKQSGRKKTVRKYASLAAALVICIAGGLYLAAQPAEPAGKEGGSARGSDLVQTYDSSLYEEKGLDCAEAEGGAAPRAAQEAPEAAEEKPEAAALVPYREIYLEEEQYRKFWKEYSQLSGETLLEEQENGRRFCRITADEDHVGYLRRIEGLEDVQPGEEILIYEDKRQ